MDKQQELEWAEAQKIVISEDLIAAAKRNLRFLAAIDRNRQLYDGPVLDKAINRYKACWLPLLATHSESRLCEGPLVVPLDCEWIWHCHRLNPIQYNADCMQLYGKILDNYNIVSSVQEPLGHTQTEEIWNKTYPNEPYNLDLTAIPSDEDISKCVSDSEKYTKYDLVAAVKRQSPFFYQVSRPYVQSDIFLEEALARYKGFLYVIKKIKERSLKIFSVPTYDIDLMWHTHQLHPAVYSHDSIELIGNVVGHDDRDSDRTKGKRLDVGFTGMSKQWEDTFGTRYYRAGVMNRGNTPIPVTTTPFISKGVIEKVTSSESVKKLIELPETKIVEMLLEVVGVRNLPEGHNGSLVVLVSKKESDLFFNNKRSVRIFSEAGAKHVNSLTCEATGELFFELVSHSPSKIPLASGPKTLGSLSIPMSDILSPDSKLSVEKWFDLSTSYGNPCLKKPTSLRIAISVMLPTVAPAVLQMIRSKPFVGKSQNDKSWTRVLDSAGTEIASLQMRESKAANNRSSMEVIGVMKSGETRTLAELVESGWSLTDGCRSFHLKKNSSEDGHLFELAGHNMVKIYPGRKLDYEAKHCDWRKDERDFMTAVEFSAENPYGKAVALLDLKFGSLRANEEWFVLPGLLLAFVLFDTLRKEGYESLFVGNGEVNHCDDESAKLMPPASIAESGVQLIATVESTLVALGKPSACGAGCGGGCGNAVKSGECGSGCGTCCGNVVNGSCCAYAANGSCCLYAANSSCCGSTSGYYAVNSGACGLGTCLYAANSSCCGSTSGYYAVNSGACGLGTCLYAANSSCCGSTSGFAVNSSCCGSTSGWAINSGGCGGFGSGCGGFGSGNIDANAAPSVVSSIPAMEATVA